jgi:rfaE bifunctional protein nucleotidyltransferase chain/domain
MSVVNIAVFQFSPIQNAPLHNLQKVSDAIKDAARQGADLFLLPELWLTGPLSANFVFDDTCRQVVGYLNHLAHETGIVIIGTFPTTTDMPELFYNSTYLTSPFADATELYRKIHLFAPMQEDRYFLPGEGAVHNWLSLRDNKKICIGVMTCFDLRFPEHARKLVWGGAELLLVSALWPESRMAHFDCLLKARAIENQCFVAASNACGHVADYIMGGGSKVIDPMGEVLYEAGAKESLFVVSCALSATQDVRGRFQTHLPPGTWFWHGRHKLVDVNRLSTALLCRRRVGQRVVFTNGCFDLLHAGHVHYLEEARRQGDCLVVGLNSDRSVAALKGHSRPINNELYRASVLSALACVDYVIIFNETNPLSLIESIGPDVLVKGADWREDDIVGADLVKKRGGRILRIPFSHNISTSAIVKKILDDHQE